MQSGHDGYIGIRDFRGDLIRSFQREGHGIFPDAHLGVENESPPCSGRKALGLTAQTNGQRLVHDSMLPRSGPTSTKAEPFQRESAREEKDERHICPTQLDVIERAMELWSNPGDTVLSPFAGIGSEGFVAILQGRKFIGIELKASYWKQAAENLEAAANEAGQIMVT